MTFHTKIAKNAKAKAFTTDFTDKTRMYSAITDNQCTSVVKTLDRSFATFASLV